MLSTDQKGTIAELAIIQEALKLEVDVYKPCFDGGATTSSSASKVRSSEYSASGRA